MQTVPLDDQELDPNDIEDHEEARGDEVSAEASGPDAEHEETAAPDLGPELEKEIERVIIDEPKSKNQVIPEDLINKPLEPKDFYDDGKI